MPTSVEQAYLDKAESTRHKRMKWFRDARFGMFIHWGLDAQLGPERERNDRRKL